MAYYNYKELRDALPPEMVEKWAQKDGSADYDSTLWSYGAKYIKQLKKERDQARSHAVHWRDIAAGPSAKDGSLPWENADVEARRMSTNPPENVVEVASHDLFGWRHIGELGEIAYMEDGSRRWTLKAGWEDMRLFLVYLRSGEIETHFAYIDDGGTLCDHNGDDVGWLWCDAEYFMDIPAHPSLPNADMEAPNL